MGEAGLDLTPAVLKMGSGALFSGGLAVPPTGNETDLTLTTRTVNLSSLTRTGWIVSAIGSFSSSILAFIEYNELGLFTASNTLISRTTNGASAFTSPPNTLNVRVLLQAGSNDGVSKWRVTNGYRTLIARALMGETGLDLLPARIAFGNGAPATPPTGNEIALANEFAEGGFFAVYRSGDTVIAFDTLPSAALGTTFNEVGLFTASGELIAIYHTDGTTINAPEVYDVTFQLKVEV